jgi:hypothetical protein
MNPTSVSDECLAAGWFGSKAGANSERKAVRQTEKQARHSVMLNVIKGATEMANYDGR